MTRLAANTTSRYFRKTKDASKTAPLFKHRKYLPRKPHK